ncbi:MAG: DUF86 domain-containing protein [Candidatus Omnitrophica bacterium]|nr:DUF86 domain-containing protein [Candidatus Omnitrophota bacterium]
MLAGVPRFIRTKSGSSVQRFSETEDKIFCAGGSGASFVKNRNYELYLDEIKEAVDSILLYNDGLTIDDFINDKKTRDATIRNFEIIGEAANQLPDNIRKNYPDIPWRDLTDFRNVIIHEYFGINYRILWDIISNEIPLLKQKIEQYNL